MNRVQAIVSSLFLAASVQHARSETVEPEDEPGRTDAPSESTPGSSC